jgi:formamidase
VPQQQGPVAGQGWGYTGIFAREDEQAYLLLGAAVIEGRFSGVADVPNSCATVYLPAAIFDFDIRPSADRPQRAGRGNCAG